MFVLDPARGYPFKPFASIVQVSTLIECYLWNDFSFHMIICSWCSFTFTIPRTTIVIKFWRFTIGFLLHIFLFIKNKIHIVLQTIRNWSVNENVRDFKIPTISVISKNFVLKRGVPEECTDTRFFPWLNRISSVSDKRVWWFSLWNRISWYSGSFVTFETLWGMLAISSKDWSLMGLVTLLFSSSSEIVIEMFSVCLNNGTKWFGVNGSSVLKCYFRPHDVHSRHTMSNISTIHYSIETLDACEIVWTWGLVWLNRLI